uniref:hypothetical protein n=1 Tax=Herbidospora sakaeratensis TaxID=564415 RepID=UPI0007859FAD|nr:hypothetical protein [Herbidospora sakaeratensis]
MVDWLQTPVGQLGVIGAVFSAMLALFGLVLRLIFTGKLVPSNLVPRSTLEDVRADRDARIAEAVEDAEAWQKLFQQECAAHNTTREARIEDLVGRLAVNTEAANLAATLLTEIRRSQIEARDDH